MTAKGIIIQVGVFAAAIGLLIFLVLSPKNYSVNKLKNEAQQEEKASIQQDIDEVKKTMDPKDLSVISDFEKKFGSTTGNEKIQWMDSIIRFWDRNMRPAISAVYAKDKAELTDKLADYMIAGERFIGVGEFLEEADKPWAYKEAKKIFEKVVQQDPENADAQIDLAICYMNDMDPENPMKGIQILRTVVDKEPKNTRAILQLGHFSVISGQYSKAIDRYQQALEIDPGLSEAYFHLGDTYAKMGEMDKAEKYLLIYRGYLKGEEEKKALDKYIEDLKVMSNK
jgi:tetratricopeptide (TPR) repeat protein